MYLDSLHQQMLMIFTHFYNSRLTVGIGYFKFFYDVSWKLFWFYVYPSATLVVCANEIFVEQKSTDRFVKVEKHCSTSFIITSFTL